MSIVTDRATDEVLFADEIAKRNPKVDDVCHGNFMEVVEDDPFPPDGEFLTEFSADARVVGQQ